MVLQAAAPPPLQAAAAVRPRWGRDDASAPNEEEGCCHEPMRERGRDEEERGRELQREGKSFERGDRGS